MSLQAIWTTLLRLCLRLNRGERRDTVRENFIWRTLWLLFNLIFCSLMTLAEAT